MNKLLILAGVAITASVHADHYIHSGPAFKDCPVCPDMVIIPAGIFEYTNPWDGRPLEKRSAKQVKIASFALAKTEVTQSQWRAIMGSIPLQPRQCDDCPVVGITGDDAKFFVYKLSKATGSSYRLPLDVEWEYGCRAGKNETYCGGGTIDYVGWYLSNSNGQAHPVAQKNPNNFGLYDMSGNTREWVSDCYYEHVNGLWQCSELMVVRNGSWNDSSDNLSVDKRDFFSDTLSSDTLGFRPAMDIKHK